MTAALLLTIGLSRRLNGKCKSEGSMVLANDGAVHADCSTCYSHCGNWSDLGIAEQGFAITKDLQGIRLRWKCPLCGGDTYQATELMNAIIDARSIAEDAACARCRNEK